MSQFSLTYSPNKIFPLHISELSDLEKETPFSDMWQPLLYNYPYMHVSFFASSMTYDK